MAIEDIDVVTQSNVVFDEIQKFLEEYKHN